MSVLPKYFCGVDVGLTGAIVCISCSSKKISLASTHNFPLIKTTNGKKELNLELTHKMFCDIKRLYDPIVCVEKVTAMPHQGVVSMFNFGKSFGATMGLLTASGLNVVCQVSPRTWTKYIYDKFSEVLRGSEELDTKVKNEIIFSHILRAQEPEIKSKVLKKGIVDAFLLAVYIQSFDLF